MLREFGFDELAREVIPNQIKKVAIPLSSLDLGFVVYSASLMSKIHNPDLVLAASQASFEGLSAGVLTFVGLNLLDIASTPDKFSFGVSEVLRKHLGPTIKEAVERYRTK